MMRARLLSISSIAVFVSILSAWPAQAWGDCGPCAEKLAEWQTRYKTEGELKAKMKSKKQQLAENKSLTKAERTKIETELVTVDFQIEANSTHIRQIQAEYTKEACAKRCRKKK